MPRRNSRDEFVSEMSWGPGLVPEGLEHAPPSLGGRYRGKTPPMTDDGGLTPLAEKLARRAR